MIGVCVRPDCGKPSADRTHRLVDQDGRTMTGFVYCADHLVEHWRDNVTRFTFLEAQLTALLATEASDQPGLFDEVGS